MASVDDVVFLLAVDNTRVTEPSKLRGHRPALAGQQSYGP
jgi:hypothetical protein